MTTAIITYAISDTNLKNDLYNYLQVGILCETSVDDLIIIQREVNNKTVINKLEVWFQNKGSLLSDNDSLTLLFIVEKPQASNHWEFKRYR